MATGVVIGSILLAADELLWVKELAVAPSAYLVDRGRIKIDEEGARHILATTRLGEEGLIRAAVNDILGIGIWAAIVSETVLEKIPDDACKLSTVTESAVWTVDTHSSHALLPSWVPAWPK
jgi:hypothetical protein